MKYQIGKFAKMLGVSIEAVRNYEKIGLIEPTRDEHNTYRQYEAIDLNIMRRARAYTSYGMSVKEASSLLLGGSVADLADAIEAKGRELERHIAYETQLHMLIKRRMHHLRRISEAEGQCIIERSPALYGIVYRNNLEMDEDESVQALVKEWNTMRPFTEAMANFAPEYFTEGVNRYQHGLCIEAEFAHFFGITETEHVRYYPSRKCLYAFTPSVYEPRMAESDGFSIEFARDVMRAQGLKLAGAPYGRVIHSSKASGEYTHYVEAWIPIE